MTKYEKRAIELCAAEGVRWDHLTSPSRKPHLVSLRRKIAKELRGMGCTLPFIGDTLNRHHSAIMNLLGRKSRKPLVSKNGFDPIHLGC